MSDGVALEGQPRDRVEQGSAWWIRCRSEKDLHGHPAGCRKWWLSMCCPRRWGWLRDVILNKVGLPTWVDGVVGSIIGRRCEDTMANGESGDAARYVGE